MADSVFVDVGVFAATLDDSQVVPMLLESTADDTPTATVPVSRLVFARSLDDDDALNFDSSHLDVLVPDMEMEVEQTALSCPRAISPARPLPKRIRTRKLFCSAVHCDSDSTGALRLFCFPRNVDRRRRWAVNTRRADLAPSNYDRLCEKHFEESQFELSLRDGQPLKKLKATAVPTIFAVPNPPKLATIKRPLNKLARINSVISTSTDDHDYFKQAPNVKKAVHKKKPANALSGSGTTSKIDHMYCKQPGLDATVPIATDDHRYSVGVEVVINQQSTCEVVQNQQSTCDDDVPFDQVVPNYCVDADEIRRLKKKVTRLQKLLIAERKKSTELSKNLKRFLNDDQIKSLKYNSSRGLPWSNKTIKSCLQMRCSTGAHGYTYLRKRGFPLPSYRTLCKRVERAQFRPGLQHDVLEWLKIKVDGLPDSGKDCVLALDEMQLRPVIEYDKGLQSYVGLVTAPFESDRDKPATHALAFILRGISAGWKQTVAYYLTGNSTSGRLLWQVTREVIEAADNIGLFVRVIVSDMGAPNRDMWKVAGVESTRTSLKNFVPHPCRHDCVLYFMADPPHLLKSLRNCLLNQTIILPQCSVVQASLPCNVVSLQPVKDLIKLQEDMDLKIAPKLTDIHTNPGTFQKMKVNLAAQIFSHSTATALLVCVQKKLLSTDAATTAWFLQMINNWFDCLNARFSLASLFASSTSKIEELKTIMSMFQELRFGGPVDCWKPIQTGVRLSTQSVLCLYDDLVLNGTYKFLLTGRLTQDCVENLFSQIRSKGDSHPTPVHFRHSLRLISLSQYMHTTASSSYELDDSVYFLDFLKSRKDSLKSTSSEPVEPAMDCSSSLVISECEGNALYTLAGWAVFKESKTVGSCSACLNYITGDVSTAPDHSLLTTLKSYEKGKGLTHPSKAVLEAIIGAESLFKANQEQMTKIKDVPTFLSTAFCTQFLSIDSPTCHDVLARVVKRYYKLRVHVYAARVTRDHATATAAVQHASKSAHCRTKIK